MKKKIFLLVVVIALLVVVLAGCTSTPAHKILDETWGNYEKITYEVTRTLKDENNKDNIKIKGTSTITTERISNADITVGSRNIKNFLGSVVTIDTSLEDGSKMTAKVAFKTNFEPVASYKNIDIKGYKNNSPEKDTKQTIEMYYNDEKCYYTTTINGTKKEDSIKTGKWIKTPFYDNLMIYNIARSCYKKDKKSDNYSFSALQVKVLSVSDYTMKTLSVANKFPNGTIKLFNPENNKDLPEDKGIKADTLNITLNQSFPGSGAPMVVSISREKKDYNGINITTDRIPLVIIEGDMHYKIIGFTTTKSAQA